MAKSHGVDVGWAGSAKASTTTLKADQTHSPSVPDASMKCTGGSVNASTTRSETSRASGTLGPRVA